MNEKKENSNFDVVAHLDITNGVENVPLYVQKSFIVLLEAPDNANVSVKLGSLTAGEIHLKCLQPVPVDPGTVVFAFSSDVLSHQIKIGEISDLEELEGLNK